MMNHTPPPAPPPTCQHLSSGQSLYLHLNAGDALQIVSGQARIEQQLWIAEQMIPQRTAISAEQVHVCQKAGWICLLGLSAVDFLVKESLHEDRRGWRNILRRMTPISLRQLKTSAQER